MNDEQPTTQEAPPRELEREERRLVRLRLVSALSSPPEDDEEDPGPMEAA